MKIITTILLILMAAFTIQPLFSSQPMVTKMKCCSKAMKCPKQKQSSNKQCDNNGCNPFMACVYGNFFLAEKEALNFTSLRTNKIIIIPINDNRLSDATSDCWHPPKTI